jgi:hypothetical protein
LKKKGLGFEVEDILDGYKVPDLRQRKYIWETFPVILDKIEDNDGVDRYAVLWHNKHMNEWKHSKAESLDEFMEYPLWCEVRLRYALKKHPRLYKILPPRNPSQLMVIQMVFKNKH